MPYTRKALYYAIITTDVRNGKTHPANIKQETYVERIKNKRKSYMIMWFSKAQHFNYLKNKPQNT